MIEIVWKFCVKEGARGQFELAYGPGGVYSKLFEQCPGFRGTSVLRGTQNPHTYLTVDMWDSQAKWEQALAYTPGSTLTWKIPCLHGLSPGVKSASLQC